MDILLKKIEKETNPDLYKHLSNEIRKWSTLENLINRNAEQSGIQPETGNPKECFIATSVFGEDSFEVFFFRGWRDSVLRKSKKGRIFIRLYYSVSPPIAQFLKTHLYFNKIANKILSNIIKKMLNKRMKNV